MLLVYIVRDNDDNNNNIRFFWYECCKLQWGFRGIKFWSVILFRGALKLIKVGGGVKLQKGEKGDNGNFGGFWG